MQMYPMMNDKITGPHAKLVDKELVLATFGDQATLEEDNT